MKAHLSYLLYVLKHKWFVFIECCRLGIPWQGIIHDWSKFLPSEWFTYVNHFHGPKAKQWRDETGYYKPTDTGDPAFDFAWFLHQKRNKHHWQWWTLPEDESGLKVLPMPSKYRREMLADWRGAGRAQGTTDVASWFRKNGAKLQLHLSTELWVAKQLGVI